VIEELRKTGHVNRLLGARHGVRGIVNEQFIELNDAPDDLLRRIAQTPAAALGSTRDKPDQAYCERIFRSFAKNDVRYFFYIGGNDSADTARIVSELAKAEGYPLQTFHIPKTIDNDLRVHDHTPGLGRPLGRDGDARRQLRQQVTGGHQGRHHHGPPRGLPHGRVGARASPR
jgi:6-phosphofructokinase 1